MLADLAQKEAAKKLADRQIFWEAGKALAGILAGVAVLTGAIHALSNYLHPGTQQAMFPPAPSSPSSQPGNNCVAVGRSYVSKRRKPKSEKFKMIPGIIYEALSRIA